MKVHRALAVLAVVVGAGTFVSIPPATAGTTDVAFLVSKQKQDGYGEAISLNVRPGKTKSYFLKVTSSGEELPAFFLGNPDPPFKFRYFKLNGKEITTKANSPDGLDFTIGDGHKLRLRGTVKLPAAYSPGTGGCSQPEVDWFDGSVFIPVTINLNGGFC